MLLGEDMNLVIRAEKQQKMSLHIFILLICLIRMNNHYQVVRHPPEALIQFHELAAPFKMNKLDPQILRIGSLLM